MHKNDINWLKCGICGIKTHIDAMKAGKCVECQKIGMKKVMPLIKPPTPGPTRYFYAEDSEAWKLERYLMSKEISHIGDMMMRWNKYKLEEKIAKEIPNRRDDIPVTERALRTLFVKKMNYFELEKFHKLEADHFGGLVILIVDIGLVEKSISRKLDRTPFKTPHEQLKYVEDFNNEHRPLHEEYFEGYRVPPFFVYDCTFDGVEYHHAWDMTVLKTELNFVPTGKNTLTDVVGALK